MTRASGDAGFNVQDTGGVIGLYVQPASPGVEACIGIEVVGGHKRFLRVWYDGRHLDWGWTLHPTAVQVWSLGNAGFEDDAGFEDANDYYYISYWRGGATYTKRFATLEEAVYFAYDQEDRGEISAEHVCKSNGEIAFRFRR